MIRFRVTAGPVEFGPGQVIGLSEKQVKARRHNAELVKAGKSVAVVRLMAPQQFKTGEEILLDEMPKHLAARLEDLDAPARTEAESAKTGPGPGAFGQGQPASGLI